MTAVISLGKSLTNDLEDHGVVVTSLHFGLVRTNVLPARNILPEAVEASEQRENYGRTL